MNCYYRNEEPTIVRLGDQNLATTGEGAQPADYKIKDLTKHNDYKSRTKENDIALIELTKNVVFTDFIRPACLRQRFYGGKVLAVSLQIFIEQINKKIFSKYSRLAGDQLKLMVVKFLTSFKKFNCQFMRPKFVKRMWMILTQIDKFVQAVIEKWVKLEIF